MSCIDADEKQRLFVARRHFFRECGVGVGKIALAGLLTDAFARGAEAARAAAAARDAATVPDAEAAAFRRQGEAGHPPVHGRGAEPARPVRLQAGAGASYEGKPIPPSVIGGQRYAFIRPDAAVLGPRFKFAKHGQSRRRALGDAAAPGEGRRRHLHRQVGPHRPVQPRPGADLLQHRLLAAGPAQPGLVGDLRPRVARRRTCRRSSSCPPARASAAARPTGRAASCRRSTPGVRFRNQGDPILDVSSPPGVDARLQRDSLDLIGALNRRRLDARRRPGDRHAHRLLRDGLPPADLRPGADGPRRRDARRRWSCTAPTRTSRRSRAPACWPGGWSSAACASSTSTTRAGTPTPTSPATCKNNCGATDQASRGAGQGPEAARPARRHAGDLGRRVRPHADGRDQPGARAAASAATTTRRRSRCGWPAAASSPA